MVFRNIKLGNVAVTGKKEVIPANDSRRLYPGVVANTHGGFYATICRRRSRA